MVGLPARRAWGAADLGFAVLEGEGFSAPGDLDFLLAMPPFYPNDMRRRTTQRIDQVPRRAPIVLLLLQPTRFRLVQVEDDNALRADWPSR